MLHHTPPSLPLPCNSNSLAVSTSSHKATCRRLPSILIDFIAITLCDLIPVKSSLSKRRASSSSLSSTYSTSSAASSLPSIRGRPLPELVYFIQKITFTAEINVRTALVALIYLDRAKSHLPKNAVGNYGKYKPSPALGITPHRIKIPSGDDLDQKYLDKPLFV
ncbi:hypothetical protein [Absidia glauca]|uniref:Cyclin N-terminal domain-containing protein n=1 Tax=Absidia glauca TaxID=4829 RepID=A0A163KJK2_ABSGL|nr:hypothetical protein [Absidia glauca]